jgi:hypothetical protein
MIVLIERFYHQEMLISASEKTFRCATTLQKSCTEKAKKTIFTPPPPHTILNPSRGPSQEYDDNSQSIDMNTLYKYITEEIQTNIKY